MYLARGFQGEYDYKVFMALVFRPRHRLMHCRPWAFKPHWEVPKPPRKPTMPWQYSSNFRTGYGYSSPYSHKPLMPGDKAKLMAKKGRFKRDTHRARSSHHRGYLSEKVPPSKRKRAVAY